MLSYLIRRIFVGCITLLLITVLIYWLIRHMPGTPLMLDMAVQSTDKRISDAEMKRLERVYGLDKPWHEAYFIWLNNLAYLDMGRSFLEKRPVTTVIGRRIWPTLLLSSTSLFLTYLLSVPIGIWSTAKRGELSERSVSTLLYMLYSLPTFVAGLLLLVVFYKNLEGTAFQLEPGMASVDYEEYSTLGKVMDLLKHMFLPVLCFTYGSLAYFSRFVKSNMEEVIRQDYIRTAKAKGVPPVTILTRHAFRNTLIPFMTLVGLTLPALLGGSVVIEQIYNWPGMGQLFLESIYRQDYPVIMGLTLMFSVLTLLGQLLADVLYAVVDPRISYS
ncbi:MAG: ABC transporter permease [Planctomycetales bacterium]|nr:ABC transporter permease [Planctomycetales bacterium]